jgi:hypothetical protein
MRYGEEMKPSVHWMLLTSVVSLLATGCGPSTPSTPLHTAVQDANYPAGRRHIAAHSDLNGKDKSGWTPLHLAAMKGDVPMVKLLTEAGADVQRPGPQGKTPADVAREKGQTSILQYLEARVEVKPEPRGRALIDGGVGVSEVLDGL